jgi:hypothetical protein
MEQRWSEVGWGVIVVVMGGIGHEVVVRGEGGGPGRGRHHRQGWWVRAQGGAENVTLWSCDQFGYE